MNTIRITGQRNLTFNLPSHWREVSLTSFLKLAPMMLAFNFDVNAFRFQLLRVVSGMSQRQFVKLLPEGDEETMLHNASAIDQVLEELDFLKTLKFNNDLIGPIGIWPIRFRAVGNNLHKISFDQWLMAGAFAQAYFKSKNKKQEQDYLNKLFASLYTPWFMPWRDWMVPVLGVFAYVVPRSLKYAILVNFLGLKADLIATHNHLYNGGNKKNPNFNELIVELAGDKFGQVQAVGKKQAIMILTYLNKTIREQEKK